MREPVFSSVVSREVMRRQIQRQVDDYLKNGGKIERLNHNQLDAKPVGRVWASGVIAGSFE